MRDLQLVIFDCDGVLVDSEVISNDVLARALTAEGLPTTLAQSRRDYQGLLLADIDSRAQAKLGRPLAKDWLERYERDRAAVFRRELRAVPGVAETVRHIQPAGVAVCVASQGKLEKTRLSLKLRGSTVSSPARPCSPPIRSRAASRTPISSCMLLKRWQPSPRAARSSRTRPPASPPRSQPGCAPSATQPTAIRRRCGKRVPRSSSRWRICRRCWDSVDQQDVPPMAAGDKVRTTSVEVRPVPGGERADPRRAGRDSRGVNLVVDSMRAESPTWPVRLRLSLV